MTLIIFFLIIPIIVEFMSGFHVAEIVQFFNEGIIS